MEALRAAALFLQATLGWSVTEAYAGQDPAAVQALSAPAGRVVLSLDGNVKTTNAQGRADFDIAMLEKLPKVTITTDTPWTDGKRTYEGVPLKQVLEAAGARGETLKVTALNAYHATIPVDQAVNDGAIIAYKADGAYLPVDDRGPLWILFPFDAKPQLRSEAVYEWSAWQLRKLTVKD
ncbi:MAG: molybdopterin-dependent oxidoreductase [Hyphomicrobiales bacterium]